MYFRIQKKIEVVLFLLTVAAAAGSNPNNFIKWDITVKLLFWRSCHCTPLTFPPSQILFSTRLRKTNLFFLCVSRVIYWSHEVIWKWRAILQDYWTRLTPPHIWKVEEKYCDIFWKNFIYSFFYQQANVKKSWCNKNRSKVSQYENFCGSWVSMIHDDRVASAISP